MVVDVLIAMAVAAAVGLAVEVIGELLDRWGQQKMPETAQAEMSETDKEEIAATQKLIAQCFGENAVECLKNASNKDRIALMSEFAERLVKEYGLDIEVDVTVSNVQNCGAYNWKERKAVFNIALLMVDGNNEHFNLCVRETIDTIIHELRHAVQHRAIEEEGFWNVSQEQRLAWANNMAPGNYISPSVNMRGYAAQPIEKDAVTFAAMVMEGVH